MFLFFFFQLRIIIILRDQRESEVIQVPSSNYIVRVRAVAQSWLRPRRTHMQLQKEKEKEKVHLREAEEAQLHVYTINTPMGN